MKNKDKTTNDLTDIRDCRLVIYKLSYGRLIHGYYESLEHAEKLLNYYYGDRLVTTDSIEPKIEAIEVY